VKLVSPLEIGIAVKDLEAMVEFYCGTLGLEYVNEHRVPAEMGRKATMSSSGYRIVRLQLNTGERLKLAQPLEEADLEEIDRGDTVLGCSGLAFLTFIVEDLRATIEALTESDATVTTPEKIEVRDGTFLAFALDPEGNQLEFVEYGSLADYRSDLTPET
jgi:lactoylglutathione lyase